MLERFKFSLAEEAFGRTRHAGEEAGQWPGFFLSSDKCHGFAKSLGISPRKKADDRRMN